MIIRPEGLQPSKETSGELYGGDESLGKEPMMPLLEVYGLLSDSVSSCGHQG